MTELRAPFDGIIGLRQVSVGTYASPTTVVAKLTKIAPLKVEFSVPERYAKQIKKGTNLNFSVEGKLDAFGAQVYAVESAIDPNLHQFTARALYPECKPHPAAGTLYQCFIEKGRDSRCNRYPYGSYCAGNGER